MATEAQRAALKWLRDRGCEGVFGKRGGVLLAAGDWAPFNRSTWNALKDAGLVYWDSKIRRCRVTAAGLAFDCGKTLERREIENLGDPL